MTRERKSMVIASFKKHKTIAMSIIKNVAILGASLITITECLPFLTTGRPPAPSATL